jgi:regulatory protein
MSRTQAVQREGVKSADLQQYVYYLLGRQDYTEKNLRQKLKERYPHQAEMHDPCIEKCQEYGYINDMQFAERYIKSLLNQNLGQSVIRQKMYAKGFLSETIGELVSEIVDDNAIFDAALSWRKKWYGDSPLTDQKTQQKAYNKLARKGFSSHVIGRVLDIDTNTDESCI